MKVELKKGIEPFVYPKFGKVYYIPKDDIPTEVFELLKHKVKKAKAEKVGE